MDIAKCKGKRKRHNKNNLKIMWKKGKTLAWALYTFGLDAWRLKTQHLGFEVLIISKF